MLPGVAGPMTHRIEQLVFRHPPAVVEDDHHRMLTGHIANDVDGVRASGNAVVDQIGNRSFERVPKVPHRFGKAGRARRMTAIRSEEHTSELQSLMRISYAVFCLKKKKTNNYTQ